MFLSYWSCGMSFSINKSLSSTPVQQQPQHVAPSATPACWQCEEKNLACAGLCVTGQTQNLQTALHSTLKSSSAQALRRLRRLRDSLCDIGCVGPASRGQLSETGATSLAGCCVGGAGGLVRWWAAAAGRAQLGSGHRVDPVDWLTGWGSGCAAAAVQLKGGAWGWG